MQTAGWLVIVVLYIVIGILAAVGSFLISPKIFNGKKERAFYAIFFIAIAAFYLGFTAYFGDASAWKTELVAVFIFSILGVIGIFSTETLIVGYIVHGSWDMLHELNQNYDYLLVDLGSITAIPLAYGIFCMTYDFVISGYFYYRRKDWS